MRLKAQHDPYIANKVALDLANASFVTLSGSLESLSDIALCVLQENIQAERAIDERAREILEEYTDEIEVYRMDESDMFRMFKRQIAQEKNFSLRWDERCSDLSHQILASLLEEDAIDFKVSDIIIKNIIHKSINEYSKIYERSEEEVLKKLEKYKRKLVYGSEEYEIVFAKLYEEELRKRGLA